MSIQVYFVVVSLLITTSCQKVVTPNCCENKTTNGESIKDNMILGTWSFVKFLNNKGENEYATEDLKITFTITDSTICSAGLYNNGCSDYFIRNESQINITNYLGKTFVGGKHIDLENKIYTALKNSCSYTIKSNELVLNYNKDSNCEALYFNKSNKK